MTKVTSDKPLDVVDQKKDFFFYGTISLRRFMHKSSLPLKTREDAKVMSLRLTRDVHSLVG